MDSDELWTELERTFLLRARDRDASIRAQAVCALAKMQGDEGDPTVIEGFCELLRNDPAGCASLFFLAILLFGRACQYCVPRRDVRKTVLANIQVSDATIDAIIERHRDADARVRRYLFRCVSVCQFALS